MREDSPAAAIRFSLVTGAIVGLYMAAVASFGAWHGVAGVLHFGRGAYVLVGACMFSAAAGIGIYLIRILVRSTGGSAFALIARDLRRRPTASTAVTAATILTGWVGILAAYTPMKRMIADVRGFPLDRDLAGLDRHLLGMDAWRLTDPVFGSPLMTGLLQFCYSLWFSLMWCSILLCMLTGPRVLRWRYSIAFFLCWILVGSLAAFFMASAGPCFYEAAFHDGRFSGLMDHLRQSDMVLRHISPRLRLQSLDFQNMLWDGFVKHRDAFGIGISAMPSIHVTMSCLMALAAGRISRPGGWGMTAFAVLIWIGSIQLGWHYAVDGIVGAAMALAIWLMAGAITERFILRAPAGRLLPVPPAGAAAAR